MAVKYVKDFFFGPITSVQRYAKGGHVTKVPAKAKPAAKGMPARAKPNAPAKGAKRMESPPKVGKGQGYKDGGRVPGYEKDVEPVSQPPGRGYDLADAKPFKGEYQGYADGGALERVPMRDTRMDDDYFREQQLRDMYAEEPPMARAVREAGAGRAVGLGDIMAAARNMGRRGFDNEITYDMTGMPLYRNTPVDPLMRRVPGAPVTPGMYAKGGKVSKGQAKVGKVMSEYKAGELHSGSKKGPLVKNPKQAVAIALSEARKAGAKIPRKEEGGLMASKPEVRKPKSVTVTKVTKTVSDAKDAALNEKKMLEFLRSLPKDEIADMMEKRAMQAPSMDPDMPKYRKGGMARKGVPAHKAKAMYGGGKC